MDDESAINKRTGLKNINEEEISSDSEASSIDTDEDQFPMRVIQGEDSCPMICTQGEIKFDCPTIKNA
jgi:hypothetical protein